MVRVGEALASRGLLHTYGEIADLVHDFYLEAWPGLEGRFDRTRGSFETYVLAAFARFSRRKAARHYELAERLVAHEPEGAAGDSPDWQLDLESVRRATSQLSDEHRRVLELLFAEGMGERRAAATLGKSRFVTRSLCADALAALAVLVEPSVYQNELSRRLARAVLVEGLPISLAARECGITLESARNRMRAIRSKFSALIASSLA